MLTPKKTPPIIGQSTKTKDSIVKTIPIDSPVSPIPAPPPSIPSYFDLDPLTGQPVFIPDPNLSLVPDLKGKPKPGDLSAPNAARVRVLSRLGHPPTRAKFRQFIQHLAKMGNVTMACAAAGVSVRTMTHIRERSPEVRAVWDQAIEMSTDFLEAEAHRRAVEGVERIKYDRDGVIMQSERVYSDKLMEMMLRAKRPAQYRDKEASLNVNIGIAFQSIGVDRNSESVTKALQSPVIDIKANE